MIQYFVMVFVGFIFLERFFSDRQINPFESMLSALGACVVFFQLATMTAYVPTIFLVPVTYVGVTAFGLMLGLYEQKDPYYYFLTLAALAFLVWFVGTFFYGFLG